MSEAQISFLPNSDVVWIASKVLDISLHPLKSLELILQTIIETTDFLARQKSIGTDSVVESHHNNVVARCGDQSSAIEVGIGVTIKATTLRETLSVGVIEHGI